MFCNNQRLVDRFCFSITIMWVRNLLQHVIVSLFGCTFFLFPTAAVSRPPRIPIAEPFVIIVTIKDPSTPTED